jgi:acyl-CoA thioesterase-1
MIRALLAAVLIAAAPAPPPVQVAVLGDSLALGVGASDSANGFAFLLYKRVLAQRAGSQVTNFAISGATTADAVRLEVPRLKTADRPDIVIVAVGANDVIRGHSPAQFAHDYRALVDGLRRAAPRARIVLFNVPDVGVSPIFDVRMQIGLSQLAVIDNRTVDAEARRAGAAVVDFYMLTKGRANDTSRFLSSDQFHPSDAGHAAIAAFAWPTVQRALP